MTRDERPAAAAGQTRRAVLVSAAASAALPFLPSPASAATGPQEAAILAGRTAVTSGVSIEMPALSENGNSIDIAISVQSPMTVADRIRAIHIVAEKNPFPHVARFTLGPRAPKAEVATRIRLAETQDIIVLAETADGRVLRAFREVIVVLGACVDGG
jgi:sulfur-oxidizing protein SoxY